MPRLDILRLTRCDWHGWNGWALPSFRQGERIIRIIVLPVPKRDHVLRGEQANFVAQCANASRPVMRPTTGFHDDESGRLTGDQGQQFPPRHRRIRFERAFMIHNTHLKQVFSQIDANDRLVCHRRLLHFGVRGDAQGQADHFLDIVNPGPTDLLVLDYEPNPREGTMTLAEAEAFVSRVNSQVGRFPGLYSGQAFLRAQLGSRTNTILNSCFLWIARYSSQLPQVPAAFPTFTLWLYTDGNNGPQPHQVQGIGRCDRDKFNGDEAGLRRLWGGQLTFKLALSNQVLST